MIPEQDERIAVAYKLASREIGTKEIYGPEDNPKIVNWFAVVGHPWVKDDETAWCAAFFGAMLEYAGLPSTKELTARSYLRWGVPIELSEAEPGDCVIFWREDPSSWKGHVGFYVEHDNYNVVIISGNDGNKVTIAPRSRQKLLGVRRFPAERRPSWFERVFRFLYKLITGKEM